jgi:Amt family ammonium transporter
MNPSSTESITVSQLLALVSILLVPLAIAGLALIHQGLGRSRSAAHAMMASLCAFAVATLVFAAIGSRFAGYLGGPAHTFTLRGVVWNWLGAATALTSSISPAGFVLCLQVFTVALAAMIPISAGSDRWRLGPIGLSTALLAGVVYPVFAHAAWGGGWLAQLPALFHLPSFLDAGGAGVVQAVGGLAALSAACILGPRRNKYTEDGMATAIPGHNIVLVLFGCLLALVGWIALECAASILFYGLPPVEMLHVILNATISASAGGLAALTTTAWRYRKPDASLTANGWIAGLVAGSAAAGFNSTLGALVTAAVAGALVTFLVELFELHLRIDDPGGAVSVHAAAGLWGLLAAGLFAPNGHRMTQTLSQLVGIAMLLGCILPLTHALYLLLNRFVRFRVDADGDWQGMDIRELGAGAYPEFVMHADDFVPR